jgi:hypothetical protein
VIIKKMQHQQGNPLFKTSGTIIGHFWGNLSASTYDRFKLLILSIFSVDKNDYYGKDKNYD